VPSSLHLGVSIRGTALLLIAQAPVEIFATLLVASEIGAALGEQIVDELGRRSVERCMIFFRFAPDRL
jgi:hypothetical protein